MRFIEEGLEAVGEMAPTSRININMGHVDMEAHHIALACGETPKDYTRWSLLLMADKTVELRYAEKISQETLRRTQKTNFAL